MNQPEACIVRITDVQGEALGTGFLVTEDGFIVTCHHVIRARESRAAFPNCEPQPVEVIATDEVHDIAILKLEGEIPEWAESAKLGHSENGHYNNFRSKGYRPMGDMQGIPAEGRVLQEVSECPGSEYTPLILKSQGIRQGMSGAPVYIPEIDRVIGMISGYWDSLMAATGLRDAEASFAVPAEAIAAIHGSIELVQPSPMIAGRSSDIQFQVSPQPAEPPQRQAAYRKYLQQTITDQAEWEKRYAPLFARFEKLDLLARFSSDKADPEPLLNLIQKHHQLVILGVAGAGKTTSIRRVTLEAAQKALDSAPNAPIPVPVPLRDYGPPNVESLIGVKFRRWGLGFQDLTNDLWEGKFLLVFDGLNEVAEARKEDCYKELRHFLKEFPQNRYLFTARIEGYRDDFLAIDEKSTPTCKIQPLSRDQIENYARRNLREIEGGADRLIEQLRLHENSVWQNPASLVHLASVPLYLQMLILTFKELDRIPRNEGELLLKYVDHILSELEPGKDAGHYDSQLKKELLSSVAWEMREAGLTSSAPLRLARDAFTKRLRKLMDTFLASRNFTTQDIWDEIQNNNLFIVQDEKMIWPHPLFQDLFLGLELRGRCFDATWAPIWDEIAYRFDPLRAKWFGNPWFENGITMLEITPPAWRVSTLTAVSCYNPSLAYQAYLRTEPEYDPNLSVDFLSALHDTSKSSDYGGTQHRNVVHTIGYLAVTDNVCGVLREIATHCPTIEGRSEALQQIWNHYRQDLTQRVIKFIQTRSETESEPTIRIKALKLLGRVEDEKINVFLIERFLFDDSSRVAKHLLQNNRPCFTSSSAVQRLCEVARGIHLELACRERAIQALGVVHPSLKPVRELLREIAKNDRNSSLRRVAVKAIRSYPSRAAVNTLDHTVHDSNVLVRRESIFSLKAIGRYGTVRVLIKALCDSEPDIRTATVDALVEISHVHGVFNAIAEACKVDQVLIRRGAIKAMARIAASDKPCFDSRAAKELSKHTSERDEEVLLEVACGLRAYDPSCSTNLLKKLLTDSSVEVQQMARERCEEMGLLYLDE